MKSSCLYFPIGDVKRNNGGRITTSLIFYFTVSLLLFLRFLYFYYGQNNCHCYSIQFTSIKSVVKTLNREQDEDEKETVGCTPPSLKPFDPSILPFVTKPPPVTCSEKFPLLFTIDLNRTLIHHSETLAKKRYARCCYTPFVRVDEWSVKFQGECRAINLTEKETEIPVNIEFIRVTCSKSFLFRPHHVDYFAFVPPVSKLGNKTIKVGENERKEEKSRSESKVRRPNVVILGLDGMSHMNFQRTMPLSFKYLTRTLKARGLAGFSTNAENTLPNLLPVLTGHSIDEIISTCWTDRTKYFDECPFIWKNYSNQGYLTAFSEDWTSLGIFRYAKKGFENEPTDVYHHTLFTQMEQEKASHGKYGWCYGPRLGFEVLLRLLQQTAVAMAMQNSNSVPYFHFMWATSLFHEIPDSGKHGDQLLLDTLTWFKEQGHLDKDTIFILMSDHGPRWGDILSAPQGRIERRMPFLYFLFPPWFVQKYPRAVKNLENNEKRLTSHFDLHETLKDLLFLENVTDEKIQERQNQIQSKVDPAVEEEQNSCLPRGISLFLPIPEQRTCHDAGIPEVWCVCLGAESIPVEKNAMMQKAAENILEEINKKIAKYPQCSHLSLNKVLSAQKYKGEGRRIENQNPSNHSQLLTNVKPVEDHRQIHQNQHPRLSYFISLSTSPNSAHFEGVATLDTNGTWTTAKEISRANRYSGQSDCVEDSTVKLFCYCKAKTKS